jgi:GNAT superfamily N-acetyltransferase
MPPRVAIRRATGPDASTIAGHRVAMFRDMGQVAPPDEGTLFATTERAVVEALADGRYVAWLATPPDSPEAVVGGAGVLIRHTLPGPRAYGISDGRQALVLNVYTEPSWRRCGVAAALMNEVLEWTRAEGIREVVLHASAEGRPLYERLGFVPTNEMRLRSPLAAPSRQP